MSFFTRTPTATLHTHFPGNLIYFSVLIKVPLLKIHIILKYLIYTGLLFLCLGHGFCQTHHVFKDLGSGLYTDGNATGKLHEFEHVFVAHSESYDWFNKFNRTRKTQRIVNYSSLGISGAGLIYLYSVSEKEDITRNGGHNAVAGAGLILLGPVIMLFTNPTLGTIKNKRKRRLLQSIETELSMRPYLKKIDINLAITQHGFGVVLCF